MIPHKIAVLAASLFLGLASASPSSAQTSAPPKPMTQQERISAQQAAWKAAAVVAKAGPANIPLNDQGGIALKEGIVFIPLPEAAELMRAMGNTVSKNFLGLITSKSDKENWIATVTFVKEGYVKDDDAKNWNADDLLTSLKEGTEASNKFRRERGFPALTINGWVEAPAYDSASHRLVWSLSASSEGAAPGEPQTVNYNTYQLGREGYYSLNMLTNTANIGTDKGIARSLLAGLEFDSGKRYEDFNEKTDNVAAYGLAALVGGAVLKKAGFLAVILAFLAKFWKIGALAVIGLGYGVRKLFGKKTGA